MKKFQSITAAAAIGVATMAASAWAANDEHDSHHPAAAVQLAQNQPGDATPAMAKAPAGMAAQMKAMQAMHEKMMAAKTPEEHNALMTEQMELMQDGMSMMNGMGPGAGMGRGMGAGSGMGMGTGTPGDMAARQAMMEQRMDMMQAMMQMMMDRMQSAPASK